MKRYREKTTSIEEKKEVARFTASLLPRGWLLQWQVNAAYNMSQKQLGEFDNSTQDLRKNKTIHLMLFGYRENNYQEPTPRKLKQLISKSLRFHLIDAEEEKRFNEMVGIERDDFQCYDGRFLRRGVASNLQFKSRLLLGINGNQLSCMKWRTFMTVYGKLNSRYP